MVAAQNVVVSERVIGAGLRRIDLLWLEREEALALRTRAQRTAYLCVLALRVGDWQPVKVAPGIAEHAAFLLEHCAGDAALERLARFVDGERVCSA